MLFIYTLADPRTMRVGYVGLTNNLKIRIQAHLSEARRDSERPSQSRVWIRSIIREGFEPIPRIVQLCGSRLEASRSEREWIEMYRAIGVDLSNITDGGDWYKPYTVSEATRRRLSLSKMGNTAGLGRRHTEETKARLRAAHIGKKIPRDVVERHAAALRGRPSNISQEDRQRRRVLMTGNTIAIGYKHTPEQLAARAKHRGSKRAPGTGAKIAAALRGRTSPLRGKPRPKDVVEKMRATRLMNEAAKRAARLAAAA